MLIKYLAGTVAVIITNSIGYEVVFNRVCEASRTSVRDYSESDIIQ
jgi:hypothetical protein